MLEAVNVLVAAVEAVNVLVAVAEAVNVPMFVPVVVGGYKIKGEEWVCLSSKLFLILVLILIILDILIKFLNFSFSLEFMLLTQFNII